MKLIIACLVLFISELAPACPPRRPLLNAWITQESSGNDYAIGDKYDNKGRLKPESEWSYGPYQIGKDMVEDYNKWNGTTYTAKDCLGNRPLSEKIVIGYIDHYATEERLGRVPTDDDMSRIQNGGPIGCFDGGATNKKGSVPKSKKQKNKNIRLQKNAKKYAESVKKLVKV